MLSQPGRTITLRGAKIVAREARDAMREEAMREEYEEVAARVGRSRAVPFDLHSLAPVPWEVLRQGPAGRAGLDALAVGELGHDVAAPEGRAPALSGRRVARRLLVGRLDALARGRHVQGALARPQFSTADRLR